MRHDASDYRTIAALARRSDFHVMAVTVALAAAPIGIVWISRTGLDPLAYLWIPLCFLVVPVLHHLCRLVVSLETRIEQIERHALRRAEAEARERNG